MLQQVFDFFSNHSQFHSHGHTTTFFFKSYQQEETVFQGWVESIEELKVIFRSG